MLASSRIRHAVGGRGRPAALGVAPSPPDGDRRRDARRAPASSARRIEDHFARVAVDDHQLPRPGPVGWRCAARRPPARRASARGSRCDRCGCRRRSRSRGPWSSPPAPRSTASARRQSAPTTRRARCSRSRGVDTPWRRFICSRPTRSATSPLRSRRYGSATSSNTALNSWNTCWTAHSALTRCSRTMSAARGTQHRIVEHQQLRVEQRRQLRAARCATRAPDVDAAARATGRGSRSSRCSS